MRGLKPLQDFFKGSPFVSGQFGTTEQAAEKLFRASALSSAEADSKKK